MEELRSLLPKGGLLLPASTNTQCNRLLDKFLKLQSKLDLDATGR